MQYLGKTMHILNFKIYLYVDYYLKFDTTAHKVKKKTSNLFIFFSCRLKPQMFCMIQAHLGN